MNVQIESYLEDNIDALLDEADKAYQHPWGAECRKLVEKLVEVLPLKHDDGTEGEDLIHWRWATALQALLYLGSLLEQKRRRKAFRPDAIRLIRGTIEKAYEIGVEDAPNREKRKSQYK